MLILGVTPHMQVENLKWISVWCRQYSVDFGHLIICDSDSSPDNSNNGGNGSTNQDQGNLREPSFEALVNKPTEAICRYSVSGMHGGLLPGVRGGRPDLLQQLRRGGGGGGGAVRGGVPLPRLQRQQQQQQRWFLLLLNLGTKD